MFGFERAEFEEELRHGVGTGDGEPEEENDHVGETFRIRLLLTVTCVLNRGEYVII